MLKALELAGFKSFADRARFEFPRGICVVVGPNGSGKSNIVDAVKWVLGSQSAKSLRGKEMTDVIFNGCATRQPLGTGEVTLTLDNAEGHLAIEAKEVHVTRRVYRSGEAEYLINRQPCRLRDIRDLLATTGVTTEAYCIIEQGKVDSLLQSSPRDRRVIFEEAAGISQFKVKKATAMRRMERVEQNMLRLSDIVDEVESRLRSVRAQAGKARRYRECTQRLQQLRTEVALVDWRAYTKRLSARQLQLAELQKQSQEFSAALEQADAELNQLERTIEAGSQRTREIDSEAAATRELIAAGQATLASQQARQGELQAEVTRIREQLASMTSGDESHEQFQDTAKIMQIAAAELAAADAEWQKHVELVEQAQRELSGERADLETLRTQLSDTVRCGESLSNDATELRARQVADTSTREQLSQRLHELTRWCDTQSSELAERDKLEAEIAAEVEKHQTALRQSEQRLLHVRREMTRADQRHRQLDGRVTRIRERIAVLSELEQRLEGLSGGVQEVLRIAAANPDGPLASVHGIVADLFHVDVDSAPLVEIALGERTQFVVVTSAGQLVERLERQLASIGGRVGFLGLDVRPAPTALDHVDLSAEPGVMGRADRFIESAAEYLPLVRRLLGRTWLVDRLSTAVRLSQSAGRGLEFVTSDGELLSADGTLVVGLRQAAAGVLSRRSELRACHEQVSELENQLAQQAAACARLEKERAHHEAIVASSVSEFTKSAAALAEFRQRSATDRAKLDRSADERGRCDEQLRSIEKRLETIQAEIETNQRQRLEAEKEATTLAAHFEASRQRFAEFEKQCRLNQASATAQQIAVARLEQRVEMLRQQMEQFQRSQQERERALAETRRHLEELQIQIVELDGSMAAGRQSITDLVARKDQLAATLATQNAVDESLKHKRTEINNRIRTGRQQQSALQSQQHKLEVAATRLHHQRQTLAERMKEDYGIDLETAATVEQGAGSREQQVGNSDLPLAPGSPPPAIDRDAIEKEIADLRDQLNNIGAINLDALDELEQLETRFEKLSSQHRDLVDAKTALDRIIQRINTDSRQLFLTTLETIRGHFQELFRRMFGGGEADIVVDEAEDVLECGIEIVAKPPGKEACSISLLSGGEKTLTCVALLLAVFRSKPSPFCVLDEVDAALDEANIGRFIGVLREFLSFTQFIVVTHSKKTMSGADTLYGVTMEESGVSKRVSVRFEDVADDGRILPGVRRGDSVPVDSSNAAIDQAPSRRAA